MLKTAHKAKLPKGWSYPIGAQALSEWLDGISGAELKSIYFSGWKISKQKQRHLDVLDVGYWRPPFEESQEYAELHGYDELWYVGVSPVPSGVASKLKRLLQSTVLPIVREWLLATRELDSMMPKGSFVVTADLVEEILSVDYRVGKMDSFTHKEFDISKAGPTDDG